ncbi:M43 family zinc metalloprotease [Flavobacterium cerinum]|uniref:T9SS type A sorting domain-containing protein n=1 Tax=Flavobacterium cerinum TaxID=2502784 RepID=A0A3S3QA27_9FLAO|nr:M43 family zinc metalloprotease [Flavobacterium cerinum]RWW96759.1 T9SS type A sorting domain-containing protein [Flavobacterium cerinum]
MKTNTIKKTIAIIVLLFSGFINAQQPKIFGKSIENFNPCFSVEYQKRLKDKMKNSQGEKQFEKWLAPKVEAVRKKQLQKIANEVITLPVVVHIIHNGDPIGTNENITDERVHSQIQVLNNDFRRVPDTPGYNPNTPGVDIGIEFCLAQRDPDGNATNGINHINMEKVSWDWDNIENTLKPQTQWDPEQYLNIWVCNFGGDLLGIGGFAFFPEGSGLEGLEGDESNYSNDGITMFYRCFGSSDTVPGQYIPGMDKGRSLTHEMGHFLGLRHIWGDGEDCTATDYCNDTPTAIAMNLTCVPNDSCPDDEGSDMIENHMDYTPDECKSVFTNDQKNRMLTVLQNAKRRSSLIISNACSTTASINENELQGIKIHPNPASNVLFISSDQIDTIGSYAIYNTLGQLVDSNIIRFSVDLHIDTSILSQGIYNITIIQENKTISLKFIKE